MEALIQNKIAVGIALARVQAHESSVQAGNWDHARTVDEALTLIYRDVSTAIEMHTVLGKNAKSTRLDDKITVLEEKLADVIIRVLDVAGQKNLNIAAAVVAKLQYNEMQSKLLKKDY